ncbi:HNH endonuclease [Paenibacillus cymbidii]|uniref:HNH endonuclease n=1 Tax=Paenibacillus cymbidii TaxID=1639034 RepID=UPI001081E70D|nr:HNH endonuclease signature motif containing protein [Paenibacillus cymbidii]
MTNAGTTDKAMKICSRCGVPRPLQEFKRRTGRRSRSGERRGACRTCRQAVGVPVGEEAAAVPISHTHAHAPRPSRRATIRPLPGQPDFAIPSTGFDLRALRPDRTGVVRMRGRTDKGKRWLQPTDMETAVTLVREKAAVVVSPHTIRRLFSNKEFRDYILDRDGRICFFCGGPGDTLDHLVPRSKGGHTTPVNCVCACNECNQSKANRDLDDYLSQ